MLILSFSHSVRNANTRIRISKAYKASILIVLKTYWKLTLHKIAVMFQYQLHFSIAKSTKLPTENWFSE